VFLKLSKYAGILILILIITNCKDRISQPRNLTGVKTDSLAAGNKNDEAFLYGIQIDSFNVITGHIKRNELLATILLSHGITMQEIDILVKKSASVFDVRKIRSGNSYTIFCDNDSIGRARYLVYEHDPSTCYVFSLKDSLYIKPYKKAVKKSVKFASVTIKNSLWEDMLEAGLHPSLASGLSDIFAWTVDFFGLQKGDSFKVIYEEITIDEKSMGAGKIFGAQFSSAGKTITAIPFIQDGVEGYYESDGTSLRKAFLKAPLQFSRISSRFSSSRLHPILRIRRPHFGVDYAAPVGTPVHSVGDGRVTETGFENGSGRIVRIKHNSVYSTAYLHLSRFGEGVKPGSYVKQGDIIGYVGTSGLSTGPHLDFRFYMNGSPVDPLKVEAPPVEPISEVNLEEFKKIKKVILSLLDTF
jgi:murein DD-endopeptidase MepM/ murein hydrolase activator NlpD